MDQIDFAIQHLKAQEKPNVTACAKLFDVDRSTLRRRFKGIQSSHQAKCQEQQFLSPQQERTLLQHVNRLTERGLPPTPSMLRTFAADIAKREPGKGWAARFVKRWSKQLDSRYMKAMDLCRFKADTVRSYKAYFELVNKKIQEYDIQPENIYNMDEKGFMIGILNKTKRIFTKEAFQQQRVLANSQDGNREWITILGTICADGTALPPGVIYAAKSGNLQDSWLQDFDVKQHECFFGASPTGWTNDELGFQYLTKIFDRFSAPKARRRWRLLFVDGHGSHVNLRFLDWCSEHCICVAVYPPHTTHRLQPLDVSLFSPLSTYYSQQLSSFIHDSEGLCGITKRDFLRLFWPAYQQAFTEANISSGWRQTGLQPFDPTVVINKLNPSLPPSRPSSKSSSDSVLSASDWRKVKSLLQEVVSQQLDQHAQNNVKKLSNTILHITTENALLKASNDGLKRAINNEKKRRKRGKGLFEELRAGDSVAATFFSPNKVKAAIDLQEHREGLKQQEQLQKAAQKEEQRQKHLAKQERLAEQRRQRATAKEAKAAAAAAVAASRALQQQDKAAGQQLQNTLQQSIRRTRSSKTSTAT